MDISPYDLFNVNKSASPYWNESAWFSLSVPELGVHGFIYYLFRPNIRQMIGGPALWDASGANCYDCLYYDWSHFQLIPDNAQKYQFRAESSLEVSLGESLGSYSFRYDANGFSAELKWRASSEPHFTHEMEQLAGNEAAGARTHLDQLGRMTGWVECRGRRYEVDCFSLRDASSGERALSQPGRGCYFWGMASEDLAFHAMTVGGDAPQQTIFGFIRRDGVTASITRGTRTVEEEGALLPARIRYEAEDKLGRTVSVTGRSRSPLMFNGYPRMQTVWALLDVEIDGQPGMGDIQEYMPLETFRHKVRREL